ncbi:response regulator transcription factor [Krasilnikovia sp. MM14-A1259]|uniref:response regulator transcription factor n=1 Tax=Krasilnikovia sp. MM14-A1259 TaxID=3373539 RepID=UPI00399D29FC
MEIAGDTRGCCCHKDHLTSSEMKVITHVAAGRSNDQIARRLHISRHTVATHLVRAMHRLCAANRAEIVARCYASGLLVSGEWPPAASPRRCIDVIGHPGAPAAYRAPEPATR